MADDVDEVATAVLSLYPRVWHALHAVHPTDRSEVSPRDMGVLTHLAAMPGAAPGVLAHHLGVAESTFSEAVTDLCARGLAVRTRSPADRRKIALDLTDAGRAAIAAGSGLDLARVRAAVAALSPDERDAMVRGLTLLVEGCTKARS